MILAHMIGAAALCVTATGYALTDDRSLRWTALGGLALFLVHMLLIGAWATSGVMALAILMLTAGYLGWRRISFAGWLAGAGALPLAGIGMMTGMVSWIALVPVSAGIVINSSLLFTSGRWLTFGLALGEILTIWNAWLVGSPYAALANLLALGALALRSWRRGLVPAVV